MCVSVVIGLILFEHTFGALFNGGSAPIAMDLSKKYASAIKGFSNGCGNITFCGPARGGYAHLALSTFHSESSLYGAFVWALRALNGPFRRFSARADALSSNIIGYILDAGGCKNSLPTQTDRDAAAGAPFWSVDGRGCELDAVGCLVDPPGAMANDTLRCTLEHDPPTADGGVRRG